MPSGIPGSGPDSLGRRTLKQIIARVDRRQVDELYTMLREEGLTFQRFVTMCIDAYVRSDPRMRGMVEALRRDSQVSERERESGEVFSDSERAAILREIDR